MGMGMTLYQTAVAELGGVFARPDDGQVELPSMAALLSSTDAMRANHTNLE
jgi:hypothetical protein